MIENNSNLQEMYQLFLKIEMFLKKCSFNFFLLILNCLHAHYTYIGYPYSKTDITKKNEVCFINI